MIPFVKNMTFRYGEVDQVSPRIRRVVANNPGPFTYLGTGTYIIGSGEVAVIDPGPDDLAHLQAIRDAIPGETVSAILITHTHIDHSPLARPLAAQTGAVIFGRADPAAGSAEEDNQADFRPDVEVLDGQIITGADWTLTAIATPGHASNHVCYLLAEENALFSGDHIMGWSTTVVSPLDGNMSAYYESLDKVEALGAATLWPTHGPPVTKVQPFIAAYRAHRLERERQILAELAKGPRKIGAIERVLYTAVDPRLHPAAARSVLAHLQHLAHLGTVTTDGAPGPDSVYRRI